MLRNILIGFSVILLGCGAILVFYGGYPPGIACVMFGAIVLAGTLHERVHYKPDLGTPPGPEWVKTAERFLDDKTGEPITVYVEPKTGERAYVRE